MRNSKLVTMAASAAMGLFSSTAWSLPGSTTDLWDISQGSVVTANSPVLDYGGLPYQSDPRNMFGNTQAGSVEPSNTAFSDFTPDGYVHWVEWQTPSAITLRSFNLIATHDGDPYTREQRGMDRFTLYASDGADFIELYTIDLTGNAQYDPTGSLHPCHCLLVVETNLAPFTSDSFRAEFVQAGPPGIQAGIRIAELDGYDTFITGLPIPGDTPRVPEPATFGLLGAGLTGLGLMRRYRQRAALP